MPMANVRSLSLPATSDMLVGDLGIDSLEIRMTPSTSVVSARHLRMCSLRPRMSTEKIAVVNTFICATIENVDASRFCNARKPRMFITRYVTAGTSIFHECATRKQNLFSGLPSGTSLGWPPKTIC